MRRTAFALPTLFAVLALPAALAAQTAGVPRIHDADPHRLALTDGTGAPVFFPLGFYGASITMASNDPAWRVIGPQVPTPCPCDGDPATPATCDPYPAEVAFKAFADTLADNGLNYFRAWINWGAIYVCDPDDLTGCDDDWDYHMVHPYRRAKGGSAADGGKAFDLTAPNSCYYELLERQIAYAASKNLVAQLALFDCWHVSEASHAYRDYFKEANNVNEVDWTQTCEWFDRCSSSTKGTATIAALQADFVANVMEAVGDRPNVIWETCNEDQGKSLGDLDDPVTAISEWDLRIAGEISPGFLIVPLDLPEHRTVAGYHTPDPNPSHEESVAEMHDSLGMAVLPPSPPRQFDWGVPLITDNDCCPPLAAYGAIPREKAWAALTAGAHTDFFVDTVAVNSGLMARSDVQIGMAQVGYVGKFLRDFGVDLIDMIPADPWVASTTGAWAYARPGEEFVVYLRRPPGATTPSVTVSSLPASFTARWFNPRTGQAPTNPAGTGPTFTAPGSGDWVLYIRATAQPLAVTQHPASQMVLLNGSATFQVVATGGTGTLHYGWQFSANGTPPWADLSDGSDISGATTATLTIDPVTSPRVGYYRAKVTDSATPQSTTIYSNAAQLSLSTPQPCVPSATTLCLRNNRFKVQVSFVHPQSGTQNAIAFPRSQGSGYFWFFSGTNLEVAVKILQGANAWWVFHGAATNVSYTVTVTDTQSALPPKVYTRPGGGYCGGTDLAAFPLGNPLLENLPEEGQQFPTAFVPTVVGVSGTPVPRAVCTPSPTRLCQQGGRFQVEVFLGGVAKPAVALTLETGAFTFFTPDNDEVFVKVLDGRASNGHYWVFYGSLSSEAYSLRIVDTLTGRVKTYENPSGTYCGSADVEAFPDTPLAITQHPVDRTVALGGSATLQVAASGGTTPYTHRWQYSVDGSSWADLNNGNGISGATTATLTVNPVTAARIGFYRAKVTDSADPFDLVYSNAARLSLAVTPCTPSSTALCLRNNRFRVQATFVHNGSTLTAQAFPQSQGTGLFWFFSGTNLEVGVKILQGTNAWWVFHGAATDLAYTLTVTDTQTGAQKVYSRPAGTLCGGTDLNAFPLGSLLLAELAEGDGDLAAGGEPLPRAVCTPSGTRLCQQGNRFQVEIQRGGVAQPAVALTSETGMFWFFSPDNGEAFVKVLDGRGLNGHFWVYYGSMSDQAYTIVVTDTQTGAVRQYVNPLGTYCGGSDTMAFPG